MEISDHLFSKLLSEYAAATDHTEDVRLAVTMAAMYSGIVGHALEKPLNFIAKAQWLLKAVELGSMSAVQSIFADRNVLRMVESIGRLILSHEPAGFKTPSISQDVLMNRLTEFASRPDVQSLNLLVFLGGGIPSRTTIEDLAASAESHAYWSPATRSTNIQERLRQAFPALQVGEFFEQMLSEDLQHLTSDAIDLVVGTQDEVVGYAYRNDLENLAKLPRSKVDPAAQALLGIAVLSGSVEVARYLLKEYHADPNARVEIPDRESSVGSPTFEDGEMDLDTSDTEVDIDDAGVDSDGTVPPEDEGELVGSSPDFMMFERGDPSIFDISVQFGQRDISRALLDYGAVVHAASGDTLSSLHWLARFDNADLTRLLCQSAADHNTFREVVHSKPRGGGPGEMDAIECIMHSGLWNNVATMFEFGVDPNAGADETSLLFLAVKPLAPAPGFILKALLDLGANVDPPLVQQQPALFWAIGSSNVVATHLLLSYGASLTQPDGGSFVDFAAECVTETASHGGNIEVVDKTGRATENGMERVRNASKVIRDMTVAARERAQGWKEALDQLLDNCGASCKGRTWLADDPVSPTLLLETVVVL